MRRFAMVCATLETRMRIATWNVNSVKQRLDHLKAWLDEARPDVVCLQEIKCQTEAFPSAEIEALGYNVAVHGQKGFNGVALLSKRPFDEVKSGLPGDQEDVQSRYLEAVVSVEGGGVVRVASIYLPNGNPPETEKYEYKIGWMDRLIGHARDLLLLEEPLVLAGDYNVIPDRTGRKAAGTVDRRCAVPAAHTGEIPGTRQPRPDRSLPRLRRPGWAVHLLGLPGRRLAKEQRHPHRPPAALAASR